MERFLNHIKKTTFRYPQYLLSYIQVSPSSKLLKYGGLEIKEANMKFKMIQWY